MLSTQVYSGVFSSAVVKLYSDGKLVATYQAKSGGKLIGSCYVFSSKSNIHKKKITVCGTFSIEEKE